MRNLSGFFASALFVVALCTVPLAAAPRAWAVDSDCDGVDDSVDNCPTKFNPDQSDIDGDHIGDRCDSDKDGDTIANASDNCPKDANVDQTDSDGDGVGDACDECPVAPGGDVVNRHGCSIAQVCPCSGPDDQTLWHDHDAYIRCVKKAARNFAIHDLITSDQRHTIVDDAVTNSCGVLTPVAGDNDGDGVPDASDNCPSTSNPGQRNTDGDSFGDACDSDKDNDGVLNANDNCPLVANADGQSADADSDGVGDACDVCSGTTSGDIVDRDGCSVAQHCPCDADEDGKPWASHSKYRRCVSDEVFRMRLLGLMTSDQADTIRSDAAASTCGNRPPLCQ
ncbi:MAG TPA: thrombospondin type 3 repeat-containing protein [Candidatus Binatia bacterium]|jgi:hypothetical protein